MGCVCGRWWFVFLITAVRKILNMNGHWSKNLKEERK